MSLYRLTIQEYQIIIWCTCLIISELENINLKLVDGSDSDRVHTNTYKITVGESLA